MDDALSLAIFAGLTDIIPFVGGYVATAPTVAAVSDRGALTMLAIFGVGMLYQEFESRILVPPVHGRVLRLSPALVLIALTMGTMAEDAQTIAGKLAQKIKQTEPDGGIVTAAMLAIRAELGADAREVAARGAQAAAAEDREVARLAKRNTAPSPSAPTKP